jgi:hypothetical protein
MMLPATIGAAGDGRWEEGRWRIGRAVGVLEIRHGE